MLLATLGVLTETLYLNRLHDNEIQSYENDHISPADLVHLTLNITLPNQSITLKRISKSNPAYDLSYSRNKLNEYYPEWSNDCTLYGTDANGTGYSNGEMFIEIENSGRLLYDNYPAEKRWEIYWRSELYGQQPTENRSIDYDQWPPGAIPINGSITQDEAYDIAIDYSRNHGGLPKNWYLFYEMEAEIYLCMGPHHIINDYSFIIHRKIDGNPIAGGDGITISVTPLGEVSYYSVNWWKLHVSNEDVNVKSASKAIRYLDKNTEGYQTVEQMEIGYAAPYDLGIGDFDPLKLVWIIHFKDRPGDPVMYIDAVDLKFWN